MGTGTIDRSKLAELREAAAEAYDEALGQIARVCGPESEAKEAGMRAGFLDGWRAAEFALRHANALDVIDDERGGFRTRAELAEAAQRAAEHEAAQHEDRVADRMAALDADGGVADMDDGPAPTGKAGAWHVLGDPE